VALPSALLPTALAKAVKQPVGAPKQFSFLVLLLLLLPEQLELFVRVS
jgi:hypothetical protein